ncbi:hypothetical protein FB45DRAFT_838799 [Roridomyces roridus]|uniref:Bromo domain-containing protein n=1 Tax=Roridomyces roridus TaxID=1738132 RepID=A0AAD7BH62_9AGAR|nr:hypothetical protein FB45DRAFT_838799 [Roridomyces roridus]
MVLTTAQKTAIEQVIDAITSATGSPRKRQLCGMFLELVDRADWPEYFEVIPQPRSLNNIRTALEKNRYKDSLEAYTDISLVFWNALYYNEPGSQIAADAQTLKNLLDSEWNSKPGLAAPRTSPPPSSAQKVHAHLNEPTPPPAAPVPAPAPRQPQTPAAPGAVAPVASTSTLLYEKPTPIIPAPIPLLPSPESSDSEEDFPETTPTFPTDAQIVRHLERGLVRHTPLVGDDGGWMADIKHERHLEIMQAIKNYRDANNVKLSSALDSMPEDKLAITFKLLESRSRSKTFYTSSRSFDMDVARMMESGRRYYLDRDTAVAGAGGEEWGKVVTLQRVAQALTCLNPPPLPLSTPLVLSQSLRAAGPHAVEQLVHKGLTISPGDYVHISAGAEDSETVTGGVGAGLGLGNPAKPLVARVAECWKDDSGEGGVTVRWYLRAEEISHLMPQGRNRGTVEGEVVQTDKTTHHLLIDILERVVVQHIYDAARGRPRAPVWYPSWPVYVCGWRWDGFKGRVRKIPKADWYKDPDGSRSGSNLDLFERSVRLGRVKKQGAIVDRSVVTAGGQAVTSVDKLPVETTRHFDRDANTGEVLWFSGPPMHMAREPPPRHSLEYLHFLARKYEPEIEEPKDDAETMVNGNGDVEMTSEPPAKRQKTEETGFMSASERIRQVLLTT